MRRIWYSGAPTLLPLAPSLPLLCCALQTWAAEARCSGGGIGAACQRLLVHDSARSAAACRWLLSVTACLAGLHGAAFGLLQATGQAGVDATREKPIVMKAL